MLGVKSYPKTYVASCRKQIDRQVAAYRKVAAAAGKSADAFGPLFFNDLVVVLEAAFVHRLRGVEGKDGNPANEVRVLATSILEHDGVLRVEKSIKLDPAKSVLGLEEGDPIALNEKDFTKLAKAYFAEIEKKFV